MKHRVRVPLTALVLGLIFFGGSEALAISPGCAALGGDPLSPPGECQINTLVTAGSASAFIVPETLHLTSTGKIDVAPPGLTVTIGGDLVMDAGSLIDGNVVNGTGLPITLNVTGDVTLAKPSGLTPGAIIRSNSKSGGAIVITSKTGSIDIDGTVESVGTISGVGAHQPPGGGPITINAACNLTITPDGKVSSRGFDPGADLVHLQGGCKVLIDGLVESTGVGHGVPNNPPNHCDGGALGNRPDKPTNSTACVEVWAGDFLIIDSTGSNNGQVNADTGGSGGSTGTGWIDLFARGDITIKGDIPATLFDVHANGKSGTNDVGGIVTVKSTEGKVTTSGKAISANALGSGGKGGVVIVEASANVDFGTAQIQARGATTGGAPAGGTISARSFNAKVLGLAGGSVTPHLDASGDGAARPGSITLQGCGTLPGTDGVDYPVAESKPPFTNPGNACGGAPSFLPNQPYVQLPNCLCGCFCMSSFFVSSDGLTITILGQGLTGVKEVDFNTNCDPGGIVVTSFTKTDSAITLAFPAGASGKHIILFNAAAGSSSCSAALVP